MYGGYRPFSLTQYNEDLVSEEKTNIITLNFNQENMDADLKQSHDLATALSHQSLSLGSYKNKGKDITVDNSKQAYFARGHSHQDLSRQLNSKKVSTSDKRPEFVKREVLYATGFNSFLPQYLEEQLKKFNKMYASHAFVHWVEGTGIDGGSQRCGQNELKGHIEHLKYLQCHEVETSEADLND